MSISFVVGKPGGGKGLYGMQLLIDELVKGQRPIVTNLAIRLLPWVSADGKPQGGLLAYLQRKYGQTFEAERRIFLITDEQCGEFYRYRPDAASGLLVECAVLEKDKNGATVSYDTAPAIARGGVVYLIDEAWKFWSAREWATNGKGIQFYTAQHRKLGDDFLIVTQSSKQVDTAVRMLSQDFHVVRNHGKERFGLFRQPGMFSVQVYSEPPTPSTQPMTRTVFRLDAAGIGGSYDTSAGVGLTGKAVADLGERKKGLPWWLLVVAGVAVVVFLANVPTLFGKIIAGGVGKGVKAFKTNGGTNAPAKPPEVTNGLPSGPVGQPARRSVLEDNSVPVKGVAVPEADGEQLTGLARLPGGRFAVVTSKRSYLPGDPAVELVTPEFVVIRGKVFRW